MEEAIALFRTIAPERFFYAHLRHGLPHRLYDDRCQGKGYVADSQTDDLLFRMCSGKIRNLIRHLGKQVTILQRSKIFIDPCHVGDILLQK